MEQIQESDTRFSPYRRHTQKITYTFFSLQAADKRIHSLVVQKYLFLSESKETLPDSKPSRIIISQLEKE